MIQVRRAEARHHDHHRQRDIWQTFDPAPRVEFAALDALDEDRLPPNSDLPQAPRTDAELVTYVREGAIAYEGSAGDSGIIHAGEFQRVAAGRGICHRTTNLWAHVFQICLQPAEARTGGGPQQKRFSAADRRGGLCIVASPDARRGSLRLHQDTLVYSALLDYGQHVVHALDPGRVAWLHVVHGEVTVGGLVLSTGDGAGVTSERAVSVIAREDSEILLVDIRGP